MTRHPAPRQHRPRPLLRPPRWDSPSHPAPSEPADTSDVPIDRTKTGPPTAAMICANRGTVFVSNHFAPRPRIRGTHLRRTFANAQQPLATGSQTRHSSPILSTSRSTAHFKSTPTGAPRNHRSRHAMNSPRRHSVIIAKRKKQPPPRSKHAFDDRFLNAPFG